MKIAMVLGTVIIGLLLVVIITWLVAFTDRIGFGLDVFFDKVFSHAERTADNFLKRRGK